MPRLWQACYEDTATPARAKVAKELAGLLAALAHPHRVRIVEELRGRELDVNSIQQILGISHSGVSQNLAVLRNHKLVRERRDGRHVYYSLTTPSLPDWLLEGLVYLEQGLSELDRMRADVGLAREAWGGGGQ